MCLLYPIIAPIQSHHRTTDRPSENIGVRLQRLLLVMLNNTLPRFPATTFKLFPMPPNFTVTHISGWHLSFPPSLAIRPALLGVVVLFRARGFAKATRPLTCTHFNPCYSPRFASSFETTRTPCGQGLGFFLQIATWTVTGGNKTFRLPVQIQQFHSNPASVCNAIPNYFRLTFPCLLFYGIFLFLISTNIFRQQKVHKR